MGVTRSGGRYGAKADRALSPPRPRRAVHATCTSTYFPARAPVCPKSSPKAPGVTAALPILLEKSEAFIQSCSALVTKATLTYHTPLCCRKLAILGRHIGGRGGQIDIGPHTISHGTLQPPTTPCSTLRHLAAPCGTYQHPAAPCSTP